MKIQVLGSGCVACKKLYELTKQAVEEMGIKEEVEYLSGQEGLQKMVDLGAMSSPALVINNKLALTDSTGDIEKIKKLIQEQQEE